MKIGKETIPRTAISESNEHTIVVRGEDLCETLIGNLSFTEYFLLLLTGRRPSAVMTTVLDATLVAIAEHGLVPSVQASRMTFAAAPDALQGAVAAGILGCGSVILGASEQAGVLLTEVQAAQKTGLSLEEAASSIVRLYRQDKRPLPGYGHPIHKARDPRVQALFDVAKQAGANLDYIQIAEAIEAVIPGIVGKELRLNVSAAIPAVLLGVGFPLGSLKSVPILARTGGIIAHLAEEQTRSIGFALSHQAAKDAIYDGEPLHGTSISGHTK
jgi:citrate synthase